MDQKKYFNAIIGQTRTLTAITGKGSAFNSIYRRTYYVEVAGADNGRAHFIIRSKDMTPSTLHMAGSDNHFGDVSYLFTDEGPGKTIQNACIKADPEFFEKYPNVTWR